MVVTLPANYLRAMQLCTGVADPDVLPFELCFLCNHRVGNPELGVVLDGRPAETQDRPRRGGAGRAQHGADGDPRAIMQKPLALSAKLAVERK